MYLIQILLGDQKDKKKGLKIAVSEIHHHPEYNPKSWINDASMLRLTEEVDFKIHHHIRPICLTKGKVPLILFNSRVSNFPILMDLFVY